MDSDLIAENLKRIEERICKAAESSGRSREEIAMMAVTKTIPVDYIMEAYACGQKLFGENRVQGTIEKIQEFHGKLDIKDEGPDWHFIGHVQSNKIRKVIQVFSTIHSIDSIELLQRIDRISGELGILSSGLLQINISSAETQGGITPDLIPEFLGKAEDLHHLKIKGFMAIGPHTDNREIIRRAYRSLNKKFQQYRNDYLDLTVLSTGMTDDFEIAIEEGSTLVRIGTAIFGPRQY